MAYLSQYFSGILYHTDLIYILVKAQQTKNNTRKIPTIQIIVVER